MNKYLSLCAVSFCALLVYAQQGFAYQNANQGCTLCHSRDAVHGVFGHTACTGCHIDPYGAPDVDPAKCAVCHPRERPGFCNLVKLEAHASQSCIACHPDCTSTCPAAKVLGDDDPRLGALRDFRDTVLVKSAFGKLVVKIYYKHAESINAVLDESPALRATARRVLEVIAPMVERRKE